MISCKRSKTLSNDNCVPVWSKCWVSSESSLGDSWTFGLSPEFLSASTRIIRSFHCHSSHLLSFQSVLIKEFLSILCVLLKHVYTVHIHQNTSQSWKSLFPNQDVTYLYRKYLWIHWHINWNGKSTQTYPELWLSGLSIILKWKNKLLNQRGFLRIKMYSQYIILPSMKFRLTYSDHSNNGTFASCLHLLKALYNQRRPCLIIRDL